METTIWYWGFIGIMEKLLFTVQGLGHSVLRCLQAHALLAGL